MRRPLPTGRPSPSVLIDAALPLLPLLLDPEAMAPVLRRSLAGPSAPEVQVAYLRYKPATNLVVRYDVRVGDEGRVAVAFTSSGDSLARRAAKAESRELAHLVDGRAGVGRPLVYEADLDLLVQWYPLDLSLPALALPPARLRGLLREAGLEVSDSDTEPERLAYKPRRRAVLRLDGHILKLYRRTSEFERAVLGQRAASAMTTIRAPRLEAIIESRLLTVQGLLPGRSSPDAMTAAAESGGLLAALHASGVTGVPVFGAAEQLAAAAASARLVGAVAERLRPRLGRLLGALARSKPADGVAVSAHGDFNARQLLECDGALVLTDFDELCLAAPALDPATYAAYLVRGRRADLEVALEALDRLVSAYKRPLPGLRWYLASMILRRSARPFRYLEGDWPTLVEGMVQAAEDVAPR